eukprot:m.220510 g.220510  ORF g.220510 m.220510 type:complete len:1414 (+) comp33318_c0_seq1:252-4493(+)
MASMRKRKQSDIQASWPERFESFLDELNEGECSLLKRTMITFDIFPNSPSSGTLDEAAPDVGANFNKNLASRFDRLCRSASQDELTKVDSVLQKQFASGKLLTPTAIAHLVPILIQAVKAKAVCPKVACSTLVQHLPIGSVECWQSAALLIAFVCDEEDGLNTPQDAIVVVVALLHRFSMVDDGKDEEVGANGNHVALVAADCLRKLYSIARGSLSSLAELSEWLGGKKLSKYWPISDFIASVKEVFTDVSDFLCTHERRVISPSFLSKKYKGMDWWSVDSEGNYTYPLLSRSRTNGTAHDSLTNQIDSCVEFCIPTLSRSPSAATLLRLAAQCTRCQRLDVLVKDANSITPPQTTSDLDTVTPNHKLEVVLAQVLHNHTLETHANFSKSTLSSWQNLADLFFALSEEGVIRPLICLRAVLKSVSNLDQPLHKASNLLIWLVLQQSFRDRQLIVDDRKLIEDSNECEKISILDMVKGLYHPSTVEVKQSGVSATPTLHNLGNNALACLISRLESTTFVETPQSFMDVSNHFLEQELAKLEEMRLLAQAQHTIIVLSPGGLSYEHFGILISLASALNSEEYVNTLFQQQMGEVYSESGVRGAGSHVVPLPTTWLDLMPVWLKIRFKLMFFHRLEEYSMKKLSMSAVPSAAAIETFVRIERSIPHTSTAYLANTIDFITRHLSVQQFQQHVKTQEGTQMVHCLFEIIGNRLLNSFSTTELLSLTTLIVNIWGSHADRHLYITVLNVFCKILRLVVNSAALAETALTWMADSGKIALVNRLTIEAVARACNVEGGGRQDAIVTPSVIKLMEEIHLKTNPTWNKVILQSFPKQMRSFYESLPLTNDSIFQTRVATEANGPEGANLFEPTGDSGVTHYSKLENHVYFLPVMIFLLVKPPEPKKICSVLTCIPRSDLSSHIGKALDYVIASVIVAGTQNSDMQEKYQDHFINMVSALIWDYRIFSFDEVLLLLTRGEDNDVDDNGSNTRATVAVSIVNSLLFGNHSHLIDTRVATFLKFMNEMNEQPLSSFQAQKWRLGLQKYLSFDEEVFGLQKIGGTAMMLEPFYDCLCLRLLVVFDRTIHWILSLTPVVCTVADTLTFVKNMVQKYGPLFSYHDTPATALYHMLCANYSLLQNNDELRTALASLYKCVDGLSNIVQIKKDAEQNTANIWNAHVVNIFKRVADACDTTTAAAGFGNDDDCRYKENPVCVDLAVIKAANEIMIIPTPLNEVVSIALEYLYDHTSSPLVNAVALVLRALPIDTNVFLKDELSKAFLLSDPSTLGFRWSDIDDTLDPFCHSRPRTICAVSHVVWLHDEGHHPMFVDTMLHLCTLVTTIEQVKLLCHLLGPFIGVLKEDPRSTLVFDKIVSLTLATSSKLETTVTSHKKILRKMIDFLQYFAQHTDGANTESLQPLLTKLS